MLVRVVDRAAGEVQADDILLAEDPVVVKAGFDHLKITVYIDFLQMVDQDDGGITELRNVARADLDLQAIVGAIAVLPHQRAGFLAVLLDVLAVTDHSIPHLLDRKSVVSGKSVSVRVDLGGRGIIKKNTIEIKN